MKKVKIVLLIFGAVLLLTACVRQNPTPGRSFMLKDTGKTISYPQ